MESLKVYEFNSESEAQKAVDSCNDFYGFPREGEITQSWVDYLEKDGRYYILHNDTLDVVLGEPIKLNFKLFEAKI